MRLLWAIGTILLMTYARASAAGAPLEFHRVSDGIYTLTSDAYANKAVIGEFARFLVVIEFPQSDTLAGAIVDEARKRFPGKPIRYVMHTHHHAHSISSFDPFLRRTEAKLVTSPYNFGEVARLTQDSVALKQRLDRGDKFQFIDVREPHESQIAKIPGAKLIPLGEVPKRVGELDPNAEVIVYCKMGGRSAKAADFLRQSGFKSVKNMIGGILAWSDKVDPSVPKY